MQSEHKGGPDYTAWAVQYMGDGTVEALLYSPGSSPSQSLRLRMAPQVARDLAASLARAADDARERKAGEG